MPRVIARADPRPCVVCGAVFRPHLDKVAVCSEACRGRLSRGLGWRVECGCVCGERFTPAFSTQRFCSVKCGKRARRGLVRLVCPDCDTERWRTPAKDRGCVPCRRAAARRRRPARYRLRIVRVPGRKQPPPRRFVAGACADCGESFVVVGCGNASYCSSRCAKRADRRNARHRRRVRMRATSTGRVYRRKVFDRDGWLCWLCERPTDPDASPTSELAPVLDHVMPLALGGSHTMDNVRCAHFGCNSRRGAAFPVY